MIQERFQEFHSEPILDSTSTPSVVRAILQSDTLPPSEKEFQRINDEIDVITGAGMETVAQTLRSTIFYLYTKPNILDRLRSELRNHFNSRFNYKLEDNEIQLAQLERLPYLTSVIMEGLRHSPGVATRLARYRFRGKTRVAYTSEDVGRNDHVGHAPR